MSQNPGWSLVLGWAEMGRRVAHWEIFRAISEDAKLRGWRL